MENGLSFSRHFINVKASVSSRCSQRVTVSSDGKNALVKLRKAFKEMVNDGIPTFNARSFIVVQCIEYRIASFHNQLFRLVEIDEGQYISKGGMML